jgi:hypothetical protein
MQGSDMRKSKVSENTLAGWSDIILRGIKINPTEEERKENELKLYRGDIAAKLILLRSQKVISEEMTLEQIIQILTKE